MLVVLNPLRKMIVQLIGVQVFKVDLKRAKSGLSRRVPGLKYSYIVRDSWTRLNVLPAKIIQVHVHVYAGIFTYFYFV